MPAAPAADVSRIPHQSRPENGRTGNSLLRQTTPIPDAFIDRVMADCTGAEVQVALYLYRRTTGFGKVSDRVSLSQMCKGLVGKNGHIIDRGTGLDVKTAQKAADGVVAKGLFDRRRGKGPCPDTYTVRDLGILVRHKPQPTKPCLAEPAKGSANLKKRWKNSNGIPLEKIPPKALEEVQRLPLEFFQTQETGRNTVGETQPASTTVDESKEAGSSTPKPYAAAPASQPACSQVDSKQNDPGRPVRIPEWPATAQAIRASVPVWAGDFKIAEVIAVARESEPDITDSRLSEAVLACRKPEQQTAGLFKKTIPEWLAHRRVTESSRKTGEFLACPRCGGARKPTGDLLSTARECQGATACGWQICECRSATSRKQPAGERDTQAIAASGT